MEGVLLANKNHSAFYGVWGVDGRNDGCVICDLDLVEECEDPDTHKVAIKDPWDDPVQRRKDANAVEYPGVLQWLAEYFGVPYDSKTALQAYAQVILRYY